MEGRDPRPAGAPDPSITVPAPPQGPAPAPLPAALLAALETSSVPMFLTGSRRAGLRLEWMNEAFRTQVAAGTRAVVGEPISVLRDLVQEGPDMDPLRTAFDSGRAVQVIVHDVAPDGALRWHQLSFSPVPGSGDEPEHWLGLQVDVSDHVGEPTGERATFELSRRRMARLDLMTQVSSLLTDLDHPQVLREIADVLGRAVGCRIAFYMNDKGLVYAESVDVNTPPSSRIRTRHHPRHAAQTAPPDGLAWGRDVVQDVLDGEDLGPVEVDFTGAYPPGSASDVLQRDVRSRLMADLEEAGGVTVYPVPGRRRVLGLLVVVLEPGREFMPSLTPGTTLRSIARRAGMLIDTARLYAREHRLAETLQRAMLPEQADVTGLDVWTYYAPNSDHAQVGGDWYDVLQLTERDVGVVIGDVVGHDVEAAATMGQMRSVVRSYAFEMTLPGDVLERVDELVSGMRLPRASSLVYARLERMPVEPVQGEPLWELAYSRAGHLPPVLVRGGSAHLLDGAAGTLIGYGPSVRATASLRLLPGDVLVFYTDGLIERRDRDLRAGLEALADEAGAVSASDAAGVGEQLLSRVGSTPEDDVAVVVVRVPDVQSDVVPTDGGPRSRRWLLPSEPTSIARARHAVVRTCQAWQVEGASQAELVASELVANAVMHGWGHVALRLFDTGKTLRIEVEDANPSPPVPTDGHVNRGGGYGMQIVERLADWGWRPTRTGKIVWAKLHGVSTFTGALRRVPDTGGSGQSS
ncbi:SpoIIE family protein phosphatase [Luteimicrobium sp. NPDC057192]|uniref:SpoIIE family protein phosphatase n=1 Tax=Luteimicrobium sp. NPDC057192 TaxID=3346042 RepID=UPI00363F6269